MAPGAAAGTARRDGLGLITVVSGTPRSGTSLMMQMLTAGGLAPLTDRIRKADMDNPRGYFEWENIKQLPANPGVLLQAEGKVVKIVSPLLQHLPLNHDYRIVFMRRPVSQVVASQAEMIQRRGSSGPRIAPGALQVALETHLRGVIAWLARRPALAVHWVDYPELIAQPRVQALSIAAFLETGPGAEKMDPEKMDPEKMIAAIDPGLFRNR